MSGITLKDKITEIIKSFPEFDDYRTFELENLSPSTLRYNISILSSFFEIIGKYNPRDMIESDIKKFLNSKKMRGITNKSKNLYIIIIKKYLKYFNIEFSFPKYTEKKEELNKNDLINRQELDEMLSICNTKKKTMLMVLYEAALRRKELVNIKYKDIVFEKDLVNLYITQSKTKARNIPLMESIPYLKEYLTMNKFNSEDRLWDYQPITINKFLNRLAEKLGWSKKIHPHLLRHSRLTELAATKLNEPQLRKFAGWSADSEMPKVYFHLDDNDLRNVLLNGSEIERKREIETFKPILCPACNTKNSSQNAFCFKCGNVINKERIIIERIERNLEIEELKRQGEENERKIQKLNDLISKLVKK